jgi:hypothetical protein
LGLQNGFVRENVAEASEAFEFLDGAAVHTLGLGLVAQEEGKAAGGVFVDVVEAFGEEIVAVLGHGDFVIPVDQFVADAHEGFALAGEGLIEEGGGDAFVEAFDAEEGLLGEGDALDGEEFLGVDGLIEGDGVFAEFGDLVDFFEADDGEGGGGESMFAGVEGGAGLAFGRAGSGGLGGVGAVGGELFIGYGLFGAWHGYLRFEL